VIVALIDAVHQLSECEALSGRQSAVLDAGLIKSPL
jgi:hypothetical protein